MAALALFASAAHGYVDHYLASTIVGTMSQSEARSFAGAVNRALTGSADGAVTPWSVPATRRRPAIRATISVLESRQDMRQPCRRVRSELRRASNQESWTGWFCRQGDGRWKASIVGQ
ncbi:hypothetical protein [Cupriavidus sp. AU9028]|uniref:hypothetical protein n=1 Tax=Cupriavidus sp. AU9028 TaxID=2871157 RepID=UPI001C93DA3D|nr:hypothetical protein [Cupriavidus sp. AU9028]MBY4896006.1 hypothetical protein [Cupriavidus sp. AU9028]